MSVKISLLRNAGAGVWGKLSVLFFQLVQVPLLLSALGVDDYGRWIVLYSLPSWLLLANMGLGSVASNEMSMAISAKDLPRAKSLFSTTFSMLMALTFGVLIIVASVSFFIPWEVFLKSNSDRHVEFSLAVIWLIFSVLISFLGELYGGRFRAAKKAHLAILLSSVKPWLDLSFMFVALQFNTRFDYIALGILGSTTLYLLTVQYLSWRSLPELKFSFKTIDKTQLKKLFQKGMAFQAFPLGNAILFQGTVLVVQAILGPASVALFGTARTLIRTVSQGMELINQTIWPELSHLFGAGDHEKVKRLHRSAVGIAIVVAVLGAAGLALLGPALYKFWIGKSIILPYHLLLIFLIPIPFNALWLTSSVVHMASNLHENLAKRYLIATLLSIACCAGLSYLFGVEGAALSTVAADLFLITFVLNQSIKITGDTWDDFIPGIRTELKQLPVFIQKTLRLSPVRSAK